MKTLLNSVISYRVSNKTFSGQCQLCSSGITEVHLSYATDNYVNKTEPWNKQILSNYVYTDTDINMWQEKKQSSEWSVTCQETVWPMPSRAQIGESGVRTAGTMSYRLN